MCGAKVVKKNDNAQIWQYVKALFESHSLRRSHFHALNVVTYRLMFSLVFPLAYVVVLLSLPFRLQ